MEPLWILFSCNLAGYSFKLALNQQANKNQLVHVNQLIMINLFVCVGGDCNSVTLVQYLNASVCHQPLSRARYK